MITIIAGLIAGVPPAEGEIKKKFNRTQRVTRIIGTAFVVSGLTPYSAQSKRCSKFTEFT